jgi:hypothetical protein
MANRNPIKAPTKAKAPAMRKEPPKAANAALQLRLAALE